MMDVIGLGEAGCNIAECFKKYPQYNIYKIDVGVESDFDFINHYDDGSGRVNSYFNVPKQRNAEDYEHNAPDLTHFFKNLRDEVIFIVGGSGSISGMTLSVLSQLRDKKIFLLYVRPKLKSLSGDTKLLERATFGILQEYARSGLFDRICVVGNDTIANHIGNLPVIGYFDKINDMIATTLHFVNVFERTDHIYGSVEERVPSCRVETMGLLDPETSEEKPFYDLDMVREKSYFYAFRNDRLLNESDLIGKLEGQVEEKRDKWLTRISYRLYSTEYENNFGYFLSRTSKVQGEE